MHSGTLGQPLDADLDVAAPRDVRRPQLATAEAESVGADRGQIGGVVATATAAHLTQMRTVTQGAALRVPLARPTPGVVEHLRRVRGDRQQDARGQQVQRLGVIGGCARDRQLRGEHAIDVQREVEHDGGLGLGICELRPQRCRRGLPPGRSQQWGAVQPRPVPGECRCARPAVRLDGEQGEGPRSVERAEGHGAGRRRGERLEVDGVERRTPVQQPRSGRVDDDADAAGGQMDEFAHCRSRRKGRPAHEHTGGPPKGVTP